MIHSVKYVCLTHIPFDCVLIIVVETIVGTNSPSWFSSHMEYLVTMEAKASVHIFFHLPMVGSWQ